jgi:uncharacterized protein YbcV (DUF1398 family)
MTSARQVIEDCARGSAEGRMSFGEVVEHLIGVGVERYHVDFMRRECAYYLPGGTVEVLAIEAKGAPGEVFSAAGVEAAVRGAQAGALKYPAFCAHAIAAGCAGYIVSMLGRRVMYYGRTGDAHVEWFPGAKL